MDLDNKVAIITGSAQGLGKAFAVRILEAGARVCISDVNRERGEAALKELQERFSKDKVCFVPCDVTNEDEFRNLFDEAEKNFNVGCVDILVNNAGINTIHGWRKCMSINIDDEKVTEYWATNDDPTDEKVMEKHGMSIESAKAEAKAAAAKATGQLKASKA